MEALPHRNKWIFWKTVSFIKITSFLLSFPLYKEKQAFYSLTLVDLNDILI